MDEHDKRGEITFVAPNGKEIVDAYPANKKVKVVLAEAVREFAKTGDLPEQGDYVLVFGESALDPNVTMAEAGVSPGSRLKIRSKKTPADGSCILN